MLAERIHEWSEQLFQQGLQQGIAQERQLLVRLTKLRFGDRCSETLTPLLEKIDDSDHLADIGEAIIRCETGDELLLQVKRYLDEA